MLLNFSDLSGTCAFNAVLLWWKTYSLESSNERCYQAHKSHTTMYEQCTYFQYVFLGKPRKHIQLDVACLKWKDTLSNFLNSHQNTKTQFHSLSSPIFSRIFFTIYVTNKIGQKQSSRKHLALLHWILN